MRNRSCMPHGDHTPTTTTAKESNKKNYKSGSKTLRSWGNALAYWGNKVKFYKHGGFTVWPPKLEKKRTPTGRKSKAGKKYILSNQKLIKEWGTTLHNLGFDVKFYKHGGFKAMPVVNEALF